MLYNEDILKLLLAVFIGALIGTEREFRDKSAGFRTMIFICLGSTLFTILSLRLGGERNPIQIAGYIITGIGFLGAGTILRDSGKIVGLTTASTIWIVAALGMGVGGGCYFLTAFAAIVILFILWIFPKIEIWIDNFCDTRVYEITCPVAPESFEKIKGLITSCGLSIILHKRSKSAGDMICTLNITGSPGKHEKLIEQLFAHSDIKGFKV